MKGSRPLPDHPTPMGEHRESSVPLVVASDRLQPGHQISVGRHLVEIVSYLSEGGFAQIYVVQFIETLDELEEKTLALRPGERACLKRVRVSDESGLREMRNEVEVMKKLRGAPNIVQYYDSNAARIPAPSTVITNRSSVSDGSTKEAPKQYYEVLLLMELCSNNSLLDYMNQRLATKLTEQEVFKIMYDTTLAVAQMHYLKEPLIHRDIKIENVLVDSQNNFKLCDFGSTARCVPPVMSHQDIAIMTQDIYMHTTPQYRSPEMIDLYKYLPVNEKSDIWALGVFLYKLLFYTTPFEMTGQFAILHSKFEFPSNNYSSKLINLIIIMLSENPNLRPNIYQVLHHLCFAMKVPVPIRDIYGTGPYNFEKYGLFQSKMQNILYQMYNLQSQKPGIGVATDPSYDQKVDELYLSLFEIAPKIPYTADSSKNEAQQTKMQNQKLSQHSSHNQTQLQPSLPITVSNNPPVQSNSQTQIPSQSQSQSQYQTQDTPLGIPYKASQEFVDKQKSVPLDEKLSRHTSNTLESMKSGNASMERSMSGKYRSDSKPSSNPNVDVTEDQYFPSVSELNDYLDHELKKQNSIHNSLRATDETVKQIRSSNEFERHPDPLSKDSPAPLYAPAKAKHHKSNNPFPMINMPIAATPVETDIHQRYNSPPVLSSLGSGPVARDVVNNIANSTRSGSNISASDLNEAGSRVEGSGPRMPKTPKQSQAVPDLIDMTPPSSTAAKAPVLDLSYNEMDLSRPSAITSSSSDEKSTIMSSQSISVDLQQVRRSKTQHDVPQRAPNGRNSLDLQMHEVRFNSPDITTGSFESSQSEPENDKDSSKRRSLVGLFKSDN